MRPEINGCNESYRIAETPSPACNPCLVRHINSTLGDLSFVLSRTTPTDELAPSITSCIVKCLELTFRTTHLIQQTTINYSYEIYIHSTMKLKDNTEHTTTRDLNDCPRAGMLRWRQLITNTAD